MEEKPQGKPKGETKGQPKGKSKGKPKGKPEAGITGLFQLSRNPISKALFGNSIA